MTYRSKEQDSRLSITTQSLFALLLIASATLAMFGDLLLSREQTVLSRLGTDLSSQFIHWRAFGFEQLSTGNLALWNPHIFSGMPFFGGFQSALLYPVNWFHLILTLPKAINLTVAVQIFLSGVFTYFWVANRGLHPAACLLSSLLFMFCGAHFMHIYAGHLPNLSTVPWIPLLFLTLDRLSVRVSIFWMLVGVFAVTMQILAGHPQYVFFTGVAAGIYTLLRTTQIKQAKQRLSLLLAFASVYSGAVLLSAVQLLAGLQAAREGVRAEGLSYEFASAFSLPPEQFITLLVPGFFGNMTDFPYWGRWYLWEMCLFISVTGLVLAIYGGIYAGKKRDFSVTMVVVLFLLALGAYTPLFALLYHWVPGFDLFRGQSKFALIASLFLVLLTATGFDRLWKQDRSSNRLPSVLAVGGVIVGLTSVLVFWFSQSEGESPWSFLVQMVGSTGQVYLPSTAYQDPTFLQNAGMFTAKNLFLSSATFLLLALLFYLVRFSRKALHLVLLLAVLEIMTFAASSRSTFDLASARFPKLESFLNERPGDHRILLEENPNITMSLGAHNLWGYDPGVLRRYAEFMAFTQGDDPDQASQYLDFKGPHPLYEMLRCRYFFVSEEGRLRIEKNANVLPRLLLIDNWQIIPDRFQMLQVMEGAEFDPQETVLLEKAPVPAPEPSLEKGKVGIVESSTDHLIVEARLPSPSILLITDNFSEGWKATSLSESAQQAYTLMPANYTLMALPLSAGDHLFRIEYLPRAFVVGKWMSIVAFLAYSLLWAWCLFRKETK